jgi:hypothetical protein
MSTLIYLRFPGASRVVFSKAHLIRLLCYHCDYTRDEAREAANLVRGRYPNRWLSITPKRGHSYKIRMVSVSVSKNTGTIVRKFWKPALDLAVYILVPEGKSFFSNRICLSFKSLGLV